jgi:xanthine dehydrogenase/oxidase
MVMHTSITCAVADKLGISLDRLNEINMYQEGDRTHFGQQLVDWNVPAMWRQIKESADFDRRVAEVDKFNSEHRWKKRGIALLPTKFGISFTALMLNQGHALVHIYSHDGSVMVAHGGVEMGQGLHTKMAQVAATELGIPLHKIHIQETNTMTAANTSATAASAGSDLNGTWTWS